MPAALQAPLFRNPEEQVRPRLPDKLSVRLVADEDFAPFSFRSRTGSPAGISVEIAIAACEEARLACTVEVRPFAEILPALQRGEADVAVTGPRLDAKTLAAARMTRPYFRLMGRFAVNAASTLDVASAASLAGRRVGVVKDTVHARWLAAYYASSRIATFDDLAKAGAALKASEVDAIFGDNLQVIYWVAGEAAADCCRLLGGAYSDFDYFSRNLAFLVRSDRPELAQALDYGLDKAQSAGATAKILRTYVPLDPW
ncbi:MAG: transporter substrate-binding domain-containing protein [Aestuariivirga sp.]|uniref:transporter substrate-binding domain-containing protein n=1 Tax=Aestuariivirga sp. TaxID=2650926 RepID=UPI0025BF9841|nr:transporter substrate-binding domain-containing protein [Aestuariivirga sp.]MCA3561983.1 transporter substrate-binding domain-containing protein [Aestuariivirga sp.]